MNELTLKGTFFSSHITNCWISKNGIVYRLQCTGEWRFLFSERLNPADRRNRSFFVWGVGTLPPWTSNPLPVRERTKNRKTLQTFTTYMTPAFTKSLPVSSVDQQENSPPSPCQGSGMIRRPLGWFPHLRPNAVARKKIKVHDVPKSAALAKNKRKEICFIPSTANNFTASGFLESLIIDLLLSTFRLFKPEFFALQRVCHFGTTRQTLRRFFRFFGMQYSFLNNLQNSMKGRTHSVFCLQF